MDDVALHDSFTPAEAGGVALAPGEVHVWAVPLHGDPEAFGPLLSAAELQRLERFRFADHRRRYQIGHGALRRILGGYLGKDPRAIDFTAGPRSKPYLAAAPGSTERTRPHFNLSHSGKLALIAVGGGDELGIDVEKIRHLENLTDLARRHFSESEFAALDRLDAADRQLAFYRCWTRKEAYIKALGEGLWLPLDSFDVSLGEQPRFLACRDGREDPADWSMLDVTPGPDFVGALAVRSRAVVLRRFRLLGV